MKLNGTVSNKRGILGDTPGCWVFHRCQITSTKFQGKPKVQYPMPQKIFRFKFWPLWFVWHLFFRFVISRRNKKVSLTIKSRLQPGRRGWTWNRSVYDIISLHVSLQNILTVITQMIFEYTAINWAGKFFLIYHSHLRYLANNTTGYTFLSIVDIRPFGNGSPAPTDIDQNRILVNIFCEERQSELLLKNRPEDFNSPERKSNIHFSNTSF